MPKLDLGLAVRGLTSAVADATELDPKHISVLWHTLAADTYAYQGSLADTQPAQSHPVLVDLVAPDFHRPHQIHLMMKTLAREVAGLAGVSHDNVLVVHYPVSSGHVFDQGRLLNW